MLHSPRISGYEEVIESGIKIDSKEFILRTEPECVRVCECVVWV